MINLKVINKKKRMDQLNLVSHERGYATTHILARSLDLFIAHILPSLIDR